MGVSVADEEFKMTIYSKEQAARLKKIKEAAAKVATERKLAARRRIEEIKNARVD